MTGMDVELSGLPELEAALAAVVAVLTAPSTAQDGAQLVAAGVRPFIPHDTGKLAASELVTVTGTGAQLVYSAPYAVFVQASQPFLGQGISAAVDQLVALYGDKALEAWQTGSS
jgi:hypothetical protein